MNENIYHCFRCQAPLAAGLQACPQCGQPFPAPVPASAPTSGPVRPTAAAPKRRNAGLWIAGSLALVFVLVGAAGFAGYKWFQNALGQRLTGGLPGREAGAGQQGHWTADPSLTAQLGSAQQVGGPLGLYSIQPPAGFTLRGTDMEAADGKSLIYTWTGPATADGTAPQFVVMLGGDGGMMTSHLTSAQDVQLGLQSLRRSHSNMTTSLIQSGLINGLPFSRGYWKGIGARTGRRFHGMIYCQITSPNMIVISGKDSEPSSRATLPLFDAAALTLRKL